MNDDSHQPSSAGAPGDARAGGSADHPFDWPVRAGAVDDVVREMEIRVIARRRKRRRFLSVAGAAAAVLIATAVLGRKSLFPPAASEAPVTAPASAIVSLPERQVLPDGSIVELKRGARIEVTYTPSLRRVALERGEAHFQVTSNPHRPFIVTAGAVEFRAVGTAFSVQLGHEAVELLVTEGRVAVDKPPEEPLAAPRSDPPPLPSPAGSNGIGATPHTLALVGAGNRLVVSTRADTRHVASPVEAVPPTELGERLAWRVPKLEFSGTPLADAIPLFNRHSKVRLVLGDANLAKVRLSGILRADNVDTLLGLLEDSYGIRVEKRSGNEIVLRRAR